jgi:hypothetical protein
VFFYVLSLGAAIKHRCHARFNVWLFIAAEMYGKKVGIGAQEK